MSDLAASLARDGYRAIETDRRRREGARSTPATYATRMLGRRAVVLGGESGARVFYDPDVVRRAGAVPPPLARLLFGRGAVHGLDGAAHQERKQLLLHVLRPEAVEALVARAAGRLDDDVAGWAGREVCVHARLVEVYGTAVIAWAGIDVSEPEARALSRRYAAIVDGFGFSGLAYPRGWAARLRTDRWARRLVHDVRSGRTQAPAGSPLAELAASGLELPTAAVELGNLIRPTIAVSWLGAFAALALSTLDDHPMWSRRLRADDGAAERRAFAQEVRRTAPFVPALAGRAQRATTHDGVDIHRGDRLVLDVRGIDLDESQYAEPQRFRPERFLDRTPTPFDLVPQGGGPVEGHRCPGESTTLGLIETTARALAGLDYQLVSPGRVDLRRIPTLPEQGVRISVRSRRAEAP